MTIRVFVIMVFLLAATLLWRPFDVNTTLYKTQPGGAMPAGEIHADFELRQKVVPLPVEAPTETSGQEQCFGIQFATYVRINDGHLDVHWAQGLQSQRWRITAADLVDNQYRFFCPDAQFVVDQSFELRITGVDGQAGDSATVWLVPDTRAGTAWVSGAGFTDKGLKIQVVTRDHIQPASIARIDAGAFLFGWLCTLVIGVLVLLHGFPRRMGGAA